MSLIGGLWWPEKLLLCFHAVDDTWRDGWSVPSEAFADVVERLAGAGYRGLTFQAAISAPPGNRVVAVTFDDAFRSVFSVAAPVLERAGWVGTVFVPTRPTLEGSRMVGLSPEVCARYPAATAHLSRQQLQALAESGWEIGSHGRTHRLLSRLSDTELADELGSSRTDIEGLVGSCLSIAYPWGEADERVIEAARTAGYTAGTALAGRFSWHDPLRVPRALIAGWDGPGRVALKMSRPMWALRSTATWDLIDVARGQRGPRDERPHSPLQRGLTALAALVTRA